MQRRNIGALGEKFAVDFLKNKGFRIVETNYRCRYGEIDIIAMYKKCLVFVEVRTKTSLRFGSPEESINSTKRDHMRRTAFHYRQEHTGLPEHWRIDFMAVELNQEGKPARIELFENAIGEE